MIRSLFSIQLVAAMCTVLTAQGDGDAAEKARQERRTVEALRSLSLAEVKKMEAVFQDQLGNGWQVMEMSSTAMSL